MVNSSRRHIAAMVRATDGIASKHKTHSYGELRLVFTERFTKLSAGIVDAACTMILKENNSYSVNLPCKIYYEIVLIIDFVFSIHLDM